MKKLTRKQRLDALHDGFYHCGYVRKENIESYVLTRLPELLTEKFSELVLANNTKLLIDKIRSNDFIDTDGCYYDFKGKTYQYDNFIIHIYPTHEDSKTGTASIVLAK